MFFCKLTEKKPETYSKQIRRKKIKQNIQVPHGVVVLLHTVHQLEHIVQVDLSRKFFPKRKIGFISFSKIARVR